jgi:hypothetical protein
MTVPWHDEPLPDPARYLAALEAELAGCGLRCEVDDGRLWPRLSIDPDFPCWDLSGWGYNVVAAPACDGWWWYRWPWSEKIAPVSEPAQAAKLVCDQLGSGDPGDDPGEDDDPDPVPDSDPAPPARQPAPVLVPA